MVDSTSNTSVGNDWAQGVQPIQCSPDAAYTGVANLEQSTVDCHIPYNHTHRVGANDEGTHPVSLKEKFLAMPKPTAFQPEFSQLA
jgi:hypothetical protein